MASSSLFFADFSSGSFLMFIVLLQIFFEVVIIHLQNGTHTNVPGTPINEVSTDPELLLPQGHNKLLFLVHSKKRLRHLMSLYTAESCAALVAIMSHQMFANFPLYYTCTRGTFSLSPLCLQDFASFSCFIITPSPIIKAILSIC